MVKHYQFEQGTLVAIKDPSNYDVFTDGPHTDDLFVHGLPFTIYPRPSLKRDFPYQFVCSLPVAQIEHAIWITDFPELIALLSTLQVTSSVPDLPETVQQASRIFNGFALLPVDIVKDSRSD